MHWQLLLVQVLHLWVVIIHGTCGLSNNNDLITVIMHIGFFFQNEEDLWHGSNDVNLKIFFEVPVRKISLEK